MEAASEPLIDLLKRFEKTNLEAINLAKRISELNAEIKSLHAQLASNNVR